VQINIKHALIINSDRLEPVHILAERPDVRLSAIVKPKYAHLYAGIAKTHCVSDVSRIDEVIAAAYSLMGDSPFDGVLAPLERSVASAAYVRSHLGIQGMGVEVAASFSNKYVMKRRLCAAGLPVADFAAVPTLADLPRVAPSVGWPIVLKPAVGAGSQHTWRFDGHDDVSAFLSSAAAQALTDARVPLLVERFIEMDAELHCDAIMHDAATVAFSASCYFSPVLRESSGSVGSYTLSADDPRNDELRVLHDLVIQALGMRSGVSHLEVFQTRRGLVIGEIACRPGGGGVAATVRDRHGWDLWRGFVQASLGEQPEITVGGGAKAVTGWLCLPARNGLIMDLTPVGELTAIPGVHHVDMKYEIGQAVSEKISSTFSSGVAYFTANNYREASLIHSEITSRYYIRTV
jgi:biotin carboxylase